MAIAWFYCLMHTPVWNLDSFQKSFSVLGLDMKLKTNTPTSCSFLKGMWYHTDHGLTWGPLPSRILKLGKSLKDPRILYKTKDLEYAAARFLSDVAASYRGFLQVPFVKEFVQNFYQKDMPCNGTVLEQHQVQVTDLSSRKLLPEAYDQICMRYGVDLGLLRDTLLLFPNRPFVFYSSPLFLKLVAADYW